MTHNLKFTTVIPPEEIDLLKKDLIQWIEGLDDPGILGVLAHLKVEFSPEGKGLDDTEPQKSLKPGIAQHPKPEEELLRLVDEWIAEVESKRED